MRKNRYSPQEFEQKIDEYFQHCEKSLEPQGVAALAVFLGLSKRALHDYAKRADYKRVYEFAKTRIEAYLERQLSVKEQGVAGIIFNLKANFALSDRIQIDHNVNVVHKIDEQLVQGRRNVQQRLIEQRQLPAPQASDINTINDVDYLSDVFETEIVDDLDE